jgi:hypothetical protein
LFTARGDRQFKFTLSKIHPNRTKFEREKISVIFNLQQLLLMNEFFTPFTHSGSSKVTIKNENFKCVLYYSTSAGVGLRETKILRKNNARTTGNLCLRYPEADDKRNLADNYVSRTSNALLFSSIG